MRAKFVLIWMLAAVLVCASSYMLGTTTWSQHDGITVGSSTGNISHWNGISIGTTSGNINAWNNLAAPTGGLTLAFDNSTNSFSYPPASSFSWSHTCTGTNLILIVGVSYIDTAGTPASVSSITYNSVGLTKVRRDVGLNSNFSEIWILVAPATGSHTILVTLTSAPTIALGGGADSLTGAAQSGQPDASNGATSSSGQPSVIVTTVTNKDWILDTVTDNADDHSAVSPSGSQVARWAIELPSSGTNRGSYGSTLGPVTPAGATTMAWTGVTSAWVQSGVAIAP